VPDASWPPFAFTVSAPLELGDRSQDVNLLFAIGQGRVDSSAEANDCDAERSLSSSNWTADDHLRHSKLV